MYCRRFTEKNMVRIKKRIADVINAAHIVSIYTAMILLTAMTVIIIINVFMRYVLNSGLRWSDEVAKLLMVWFTFIAMAIGIKQGLHISLHILPKKLPAWFEIFITYIKDLSTLIIAVVFFVYGIKLVEFTSRSIMPATGWPSDVLYIILPVSSILIAGEVLMDIFRIEDNPEKIEQRFIKETDHAE